MSRLVSDLAVAVHEFSDRLRMIGLHPPACIVFDARDEMTIISALSLVATHPSELRQATIYGVGFAFKEVPQK